MSSSRHSPDDERAVDPVRRLAGDLHAFEHLLRRAIAAGGRLHASAAEAHGERDLSVVVGHQVFTAIAAANVDVTSALSRMAAGHRMLEALGRQLGYDVTAYGDGQKAPAPGPGDGFFAGADGSYADATA